MEGWGRLTSSPAYAFFAGAIVKTQGRRLAFLAFVPLAWILLFHAGPIFEMVRISFLTSYPPVVGRTSEWTLSNWTRFFEGSLYLTAFIRTMVFSAALTLVILLITYPVAYFLARHVPPDRRLRQLLLVMTPFWVGEIVRTYAIMLVLGNRGLLNMMLINLGLVERPIPFMYTNFSLGLGAVYLTALYMLLPLYSALEKIPRSYFEAAADLGAGPWTRLRHVALPLSREGIASGSAVVFLLTTGYYGAPLLLGGPNTTLFSETIGGFFHVAGDYWPVGAAFSAILFISTLTVSALFLRFMGRKGLGVLG